MAEKVGVFGKLVKIQNELKAPKNQYNSFGKYHYRSCEDILEGLKPVLLKHNASLYIYDSLELIGERYYVKATVTFVDVESGDKIVNTAYARESADKKGMDDSQVTGATSSYARKYALNGLFLIDDTKDADMDEYQNQQNKPSKKTTKAETKTDEQKNVEMAANVDQDFVPHGEGMTPKRIARLKKAQEITGKNDATVLATARANSFEEITEASYISVMNLFLKLMTPEQQKMIEAI